MHLRVGELLAYFHLLFVSILVSRDAPIPIPGIGIGWIGAKKGILVSMVEHEYWYR